jgi:hypothetical protein
MKVIRIALKNLQNGEWFEFYTAFCAQMSGVDAQSMGVGNLYERFLRLYDKAGHLLFVLQKSVYTGKMSVADKARDKLFRGMYDLLKAMLNLPDETKQQAAERLFILLKEHRKQVLQGGYAEESATLYNLGQNLRRSYAADVELLGLTEWVTALSEAEQAFLSFSLERNKEMTAKPKEDLRQIRGKMDVFYNAMANVLDAGLLGDDLGEDVVVDPKETGGNVTYRFVVSWNETVKKYRNLLLQRAGRRAKGNKPPVPAPVPDLPDEV